MKVTDKTLMIQSWRHANGSYNQHVNMATPFSEELVTKHFSMNCGAPAIEYSRDVGDGGAISVAGGCVVECEEAGPHLSRHT